MSKIIDSVCSVLSENFPHTEIYTEKVTQGLVEPCFFVYTVDVSSVRQIGRRRNNVYSLCVQYLPGTDSPKDECRETEEKLYLILENIMVDGDLIRGTEFSSETTDEVLSFFADYVFHVFEQGEQSEKISEYNYLSNMKGGMGNES